MYKFDFTTTAVARPDIVDRTYSSFSRNLKDVDLSQCTLYINIDPCPKDVDRNEIVKVCQKHFGKVVANMPDTGNYTRAYNWIWSNATSDYIFNLEDDWVLKEPISCRKLMSYFENRPGLLQVVLRAYPYKYDKNPTSPSIMSRKFYSSVGGNLDENLNPEVQLRGKVFGLSLGGKTVVAYPKSVILKDIGRKWIKSQPFGRPSKKARFTTWVEE